MCEAFEYLLLCLDGYADASINNFEIDHIICAEFYLQADLQLDSFPIGTHVMLAFFFFPSIWAIWYLAKNRELFE